ncbi:MAG: phosphosulfolactate synthase [Acidimicrobiales bacterium]
MSTYLELPPRTNKPRTEGLTIAIDKGLPTRYFIDLVESTGEHLDFVKFGWGTALVSRELKVKIDALAREQIGFYFGGTLFEKFVLQDRLDDFRRLCEEFGATHVEVSNGTIALSDDRKAEYVAELSRDFQVVSEVGSKDQVKSETMSPAKWIAAIRSDLSAGATLVTLETRESGQGGICRPNGELRFGLIEEILESDVDTAHLLFEAPTLELQAYFVRRVGPDANLGNIAPSDLISLETIRLGLRSDTLFAFEPEDVQRHHGAL